MTKEELDCKSRILNLISENVTLEQQLADMQKRIAELEQPKSCPKCNTPLQTV